MSAAPRAPAARPGRAALPVVDHAGAAARFLDDEVRADWHDGALWFLREKRDRAAGAVPEWEALRALASRIKEHTLSHLDGYLAEFAQNAGARGATVHWARDAAEHNAIVHELLAAAGVRRLVKSKSMLTEECGLNPHLEARGMEVVDSDLGERIVQLRGEAPSHIVMPAIHLRTADVGDTFHAHLGTPAGLADPPALVRAARAHLRERFLEADAALTGVNFAVAETGGMVICTNEGNADLGMALAPLHVASVGIEKLVPRAEDLGVFLRLLARSGTGQASTVYASHVHGPRPRQALHLVLVDNGRSAQLGRSDFWRSLKCIRCGACMNTCPVYRRSGGHSYGSTIPGPIGAVLTPGLDLARYAALPFASTLCGSCTAVCPVQIDLDAQLYRWRQLAADAGHAGASKAVAMKTSGWLLARPRLFGAVGALGRGVMRAMPAAVLRWAAGAWGAARDVPDPPAQSFRAWYRAHRTPPARPNAWTPLGGIPNAPPHTAPHTAQASGAHAPTVPAAALPVGADARETISHAVRAARPAPSSLPDLSELRTVSAGPGATDGAADHEARFVAAARAAGAEVATCARAGLAAAVARLAPPGRAVVSRVDAVPGVGPAPAGPHALAEVGLFVCEGVLGVAENGAVWLPRSRLGEQAALFLAERVAVVLARGAVVPDMHAAYARLDVAAETFGVFVAGPSKTADIEQSLVIGAHGPTALAVLLVNDEGDPEAGA